MNTWTWETLRNQMNGRHTLNQIMLDVCERRSMPLDAVLGRSRKSSVVDARVEIARRAVDSGHSKVSIGQALNRHHSTIIHYLNHYQQPNTEGL